MLPTQWRWLLYSNVPTCFWSEADHRCPISEGRREESQCTSVTALGMELQARTGPECQWFQCDLQRYYLLRWHTFIVTLPLVTFRMLKPTVGIMSSLNWPDCCRIKQKVGEETGENAQSEKKKSKTKTQCWERTDIKQHDVSPPCVFLFLPSRRKLHFLSMSETLLNRTV